MNRTDVKASRDLAAQYVKACDELLSITWLEPFFDPKDGTFLGRMPKQWRTTDVIAGKQTGAHRRLSLDLTRALAHMRRRR